VSRRGPHPPRFVFALWTAVAVLAVAVLWTRVLSGPDPRERLAEVRAELRRLRTAADSCQANLETLEAAFRRYDAQLDSLRVRVRAYEALDPRGVPTDSYDAYLQAFERYNAGVPRWSEMADTLQARWTRCRGIVETHNALAESARALAAELGLWPAPEEP
jgi:multidrug resistance efflux pump